MHLSESARLCLACGMCCNRAINQFTKVQPQEVELLQEQGLPVQPRPEGFFLSQPCAALQADLRCQIYSLRPIACRTYECKLYKKYAAGMLPLEDALKIVCKAHVFLADAESSAQLRAYISRHFEPARSLRAPLRP